MFIEASLKGCAGSRLLAGRELPRLAHREDE
jgi:hypothetical protein